VRWPRAHITTRTTVEITSRRAAVRLWWRVSEAFSQPRFGCIQCHWLIVEPSTLYEIFHPSILRSLYGGAGICPKDFFVDLCTLGPNQAHRCDSRFDLGINGHGKPPWEAPSLAASRSWHPRRQYIRAGAECQTPQRAAGIDM
jgi:hypothetical protein